MEDTRFYYYSCHNTVYAQREFSLPLVVATAELAHGVWKSESQKKSQSTLRAKQATFTFWEDKSLLKMPKWSILASFWKPEACGQTVLPDMSVLIGQKLVENAKIEMRHFE